mgnify:CR=1 FL=1
MRKQFSSEEEKQRMMSGKLYLTTDEEIVAEQKICLERLYDYNHTRPSQKEEREKAAERNVLPRSERVFIWSLFPC